MFSIFSNITVNQINAALVSIRHFFQKYEKGSLDFEW